MPKSKGEPKVKLPPKPRTPRKKKEQVAKVEDIAVQVKTYPQVPELTEEPPIPRKPRTRVNKSVGSSSKATATRRELHISEPGQSPFADFLWNKKWD